MSAPDTRVSKREYVLLSMLAVRPMSGRDLRMRFKEKTRTWFFSLATFYQIMSVLEDRHLVDGHYEKSEVNGMPIQRRHYVITEAGKMCL